MLVARGRATAANDGVCDSWYAKKLVCVSCSMCIHEQSGKTGDICGLERAAVASSHVHVPTGSRDDSLFERVAYPIFQRRRTMLRC